MRQDYTDLQFINIEYIGLVRNALESVLMAVCVCESRLLDICACLLCSELPFETNLNIIIHASVDIAVTRYWKGGTKKCPDILN